jgi:hypothetical protein
MPDLYDVFPPSGLDRCDGSDILPGTQDAVNSIFAQIATLYQGDGTFFEEDPNSPAFSFGERGTVQHTYYMDPDTFGAIVPFIQRGIWQTDSNGNICRILDTSAQWQKGNYYRVVVTAEGISWGLPPDEFSVKPVEINPDLLKHPLFNDGAAIPGSTGTGLTDEQKAALRFAMSQQTSYGLQNSFNMIIGGAGAQAGGSLFPTTAPFYPYQKQLAWLALTKNWRGEDSFYLPAFEVTWVRYYPSATFMDPGGYIDTNANMTAQIPYYFWSLDGTDNTGTNFNNVSWQSLLQYVPNLYGSGITFLKKADQDDYDRLWHRITRTWLGAPTGSANTGSNYIYWDQDLYQTIGQETPFVLPPSNPYPGYPN